MVATGKSDIFNLYQWIGPEYPTIYDWFLIDLKWFTGFLLSIHYFHNSFEEYRFISSGQMSGDSWMYPYQRTPMGNPYISPISTMGTLLGVHPIVPWKCWICPFWKISGFWNEDVPRFVHPWVWSYHGTNQVNTPKQNMEPPKKLLGGFVYIYIYSIIFILSFPINFGYIFQGSRLVSFQTNCNYMFSPDLKFSPPKYFKRKLGVSAILVGSFEDIRPRNTPRWLHRHDPHATCPMWNAGNPSPRDWPFWIRGFWKIGFTKKHSNIVGGWTTQLKNISQIGNLPQIGVKIKNIWDHHLGNQWLKIW